MSSSYVIIRARPQDIAILPSIELAAARLFDGYAPELDLLVVTSERDLRDAQTQGRLWVALADDVPVGFACVKLIGSSAHLEELDVHPDHGRRGIGRELVRAVCNWASASGHEAVTLTTYRDVPWNMPFYASLGFAVIPSNALPQTLASIVHEESERGLDAKGRVVMQRLSVTAT